MSWYKKRPRIKEPIKTLPHTTSPMSEQHLQRTQRDVKTTVAEKQPKNK